MKKIILMSLAVSSLLLAGCNNQPIRWVDQPTTWMNNTTWAITTWTTATWIQEQPSDIITYKNDTYGFKIDYPKTATLETGFKTFHILNTSWMSDATGNGGVGVVSIVISKIENETIYPRYYSAQLRIGVSAVADDVKNCTRSLQDVAPTTLSINGVGFVWYSLDDAAMMQYKWWNSYRTVHNNICYVIEEVKVWSSYHEDKDAKDIPDSTLKSYYDSLDPILKSFTFTK